FGKVYFLAVQRSGSTYTCRKEVFLESTGDNGFAPTDAVVHPITGDLYLSIGGRGGRGGGYPARYPRRVEKRCQTPKKGIPLEQGSLSWCPQELPVLKAKVHSDQARDRLAGLVYARRFRSRLGDQALLDSIRENLGHPDRYVRLATAELAASLSAADCK